MATKNEVGKRISNVTTRSNASQLANFIESLEGQKFADVSSGVLLSMMADEMAAYQNSFYLNALGAKGDFKDGTNPKIYGAILGYDRMIDDLLIGGYFSYTIQKLKISSLIAMSMNLARSRLTRTLSSWQSIQRHGKGMKF